MKMHGVTLSIGGVVVGTVKSISVDYTDDVSGMPEHQVREMVRFRLNKHWHEYLNNFRFRGETCQKPHTTE